MSENQTPYEQMQAAQEDGNDPIMDGNDSIMKATERAMRPKTDREEASEAQQQAVPKARRARKKPTLSANKTKSEVGKTQRKKRIPVSQRQTAKTPTRAGYHRYWVTDEADRIQIYSDGGYTKVNDLHGEPRKRRGGAGKMQYLMEIEKELHDEDQKLKWERMNQSAQERLKPREGMQGYYQPKTKHDYR